MTSTGKLGMCRSAWTKKGNAKAAATAEGTIHIQVLSGERPLGLNPFVNGLVDQRSVADPTSSWHELLLMIVVYASRSAMKYNVEITSAGDN